MPRQLNLAVIALLLLFASSSSARAQGGEPSREPVLRIETGMHTATIHHVAVDRAGRLLVTAADDKTARIWDVETGRLLRVLRVPVGTGNEGKLYAVALSPDGSTVAVGGWTGIPGQRNIYLFDTSSERMTRRIGNLPNVVAHLAFAPDGKRLAAALYAGGVRLFDLADGRQTGADADYGNQSYGADFAPDGRRLATTCLDGFIRLYAVEVGTLRLIAKRAAPGGTRPLSVKFSPDGGKLAVGFADSTVVNVLSAADLSFALAPDTTSINNGSLGNVAWSATGDALFAGGGYQSGGNRLIRSWTNGGRGAYRDTIAALDTILDLQPLPDGGVIYGASDPAWGIVNKAGSRTRFITSAIADYRDAGEHFLVSADGAEVAVGYEQFGKSLARFSLVSRRLETGAPDTRRLSAPRTMGLNITDWLDTYEPKLNGGKLALKQYEVSFSLAVAPDESRFLLGTIFSIRLFDRTGKELWQVPAPGTAWAVNISGDGRLAVAAYGDGTIRWYRMTDGAELLAFFPHNDQKRWVVWTPAGYYDAAPNSEDLIGWHVNNGRDAAADFFPVGQFRNVYYRPDVVSKILQTGDEQLALKEANEEAGRKGQQASVAQLLPPVVEIVSPADGAEVTANEVVLRYSVRTPSGEPVTEVKALVDGRPAAAERGLSLQATGQSSSVREVRVLVPEGESQVSLIAANRFTSSVAATVRVRARKPAVAVAPSNIANRPAPTAATNDQFEIRPKLYVLSVGVSNYANEKLKLGFPAKDAQDFADAWTRQKGTLYREVIVKVLTDDKASKDEVLDGLDWIRKETTSKDVAVVLFAGHGVNDPNGVYYYLPFNADPERLLRTGVSFSDIRNTVAAIAGKTLFFIDTCHSGNVLGTRRGIQNEMNGVVNELASAENGAIVFAASTGNQYSLEKLEWHNGAFTKAVVEGLTGQADYGGHGRITVNMLDLYISERVKALTAGNQTPTTAKPQTVPDFPVALKR